MTMKLKTPSSHIIRECTVATQMIAGPHLLRVSHCHKYFSCLQSFNTEHLTQHCEVVPITHFTDTEWLNNFPKVTQLVSI